MARANYLTSAIDTLVTGASAKTIHKSLSGSRPNTAGLGRLSSLAFPSQSRSRRIRRSGRSVARAFRGPTERNNDRRRIQEGFISPRLDPADRRSFIGGSDARVIMGSDEAMLVRLWREKRGEVDPEDLSDNLIVQLGTVTEDLNRRWYERNTGHCRQARTAAGPASRYQMDGGNSGWSGLSRRCSI